MIVLHDLDRAIPLARTVQRILVLGSPGSGKSTLSQQLSQHLNLPYVSCDRDIFWLPGWKVRPRPEIIARMQFFVSQDRWIIDGNSPGTLPIRLPRTDLVIWMRPTRLVSLWGVVSRWMRFRGQVRPGMAEGCPEKIDGKFLRYIWNFDTHDAPEIIDHLKAAHADLPVLMIENRRQSNDLVSALMSR